MSYRKDTQFVPNNDGLRLFLGICKTRSCGRLKDYMPAIIDHKPNELHVTIEVSFIVTYMMRFSQACDNIYDDIG